MFYSGKTFTPNVITHKKAINRGEEDKYYLKDHHEPIISREDFERAQNIRKGRTNFIENCKTNTAKCIFSGRFFCRILWLKSWKKK